MPIIKNDKPSATGAAAITPQSPQILPKISIHGIKAIHWRSMERNIDILGRPVTTKKVVEIIIKPESGNNNIKVRIACGANDKSAGLPFGANILTN